MSIFVSESSKYAQALISNAETTSGNNTATSAPTAAATTKSKPIGIIIGGAIAGVLVLILIVFAMLWLLTSKSRSRRQSLGQSSRWSGSTYLAGNRVEMKYGSTYTHQISELGGGIIKHAGEGERERYELENRQVPVELEAMSAYALQVKTLHEVGNDGQQGTLSKHRNGQIRVTNVHDNEQRHYSKDQDDSIRRQTKLEN
jgi:hypothetical protein